MGTRHRLALSYYLAAALPFLLTVFLIAPLTAAQPLPWQLCDTSAAGNYTEGSAYQANIRVLASSFPKKASVSQGLFAKGAAGTAPDVVYALTLCRGDTNVSSCAACVAAAFRNAQQHCAFTRHATVFDDPCILRYSDQDFLANVTDNRGNIVAYNYKNVSQPEAEALEAVSLRLVLATADVAAADELRRFGTREEVFDDTYPKIYSLAQCTPDMTANECRSCLDGINVEMTPTYIAGHAGGRVFGVRCSFRFEMYPFFSTKLGPSPAPAPAAAERPKHGISTALVVAIAVIASAAPLAVIVAWYYIWRRRTRKRAAKTLVRKSTSSDDARNIESLLLDLSTLKAATDDFAEHKRLDEGGFGVVYKGDLPQGQEIAVKRLSQTSRQGIEELKSELLLVAKLHHKNLVRLIGVCLEEHEKILVYEYMANGSLDTILFDAEKSKGLDWGKRSKIINGIIRGLQYLHEDSQLKIVHRDLKASNILLDSDYNPKISDFGLAKIFGGDRSHIVTHRIAGTYGYMSPEYAMRGQYSIKSDVFSLGVLILEIVTGRTRCGPYDSEQDGDLINFVWEHWTKERAAKLIDPSLRNHCPIELLLKYIQIGLLCVQQKPSDRPLMSAVNVMLSSSTVRLPSPSRPAFCTQENSISEEILVEASLNEMSITELEPR
uniref:Uncharacterized protein n=1 Tax=Avena sativa TaxID=4498 RepID=A0ACD5ZDH1_AVESA